MTAQAALDAVTGLAWLVVAYKLPALRRRPDDPARRYNWLTLLLIALALTVLLPAVYLTIDRLSGVSNLARLLGDGCGLGASWAAQGLLFHLNYPAGEATTRTRTIGLVLGVALLLMAGCFALASLPEEALDFTGRYQHTPFIFEYRLVFLASLGLGMGNAARLFWRYAGLAARPTLRLGLRLSAVAAGLGLVYVANEALRSGAARFGVTNPVPSPGVASQSLLAAFISAGLVGATVSAWGPRLGLDAFGPWLRAYRSLNRLYPLWFDLYQVNPDIALDPPTSRFDDLLTWRRVGFRLYRRVVEIRDGWLLLRPYMDAGATEYARQLAALAALPDAEARAVVDAVALSIAMQAQTEGKTSPHENAVVEPSERADLQGEIDALERVAHCYRRSPIVRSAVAHLHAEQSSHRPAFQGKP